MKRIYITAGIAGLTALSFAGSLYILFSVIGPWEQAMGFTLPVIIAGLLAAAVTVLAAGALWGYGCARLLGADAQAATRPAARTYGLSLVAVGLALEITMVPLLALAARYRLSVHMMFAAAFLPAVAILAGWNVTKFAQRTGFASLAKRVGRNSGLAAGFVFFVAALLVQALLGWEVGRPIGRIYNMITITHICNLAAALAGGAVMGYSLGRKTS